MSSKQQQQQRQQQQRQQQESHQVHRKLVKGRLRPPSKPASCKSYIVAPASINEVIVRSPADRQTTRAPIEVSSAAVAQPFVDPAVLERHRRIGGPT
ncbi:hypothetical protein F4820DRAFT_421770 [Hypoxylon rubiginosum]|uniref:Uncharacterized protein n=1 Tax=Hypoxylon rubiginosum TaxID=110542 RepID=A0ACB9YZZ5_9PEZI|nr:hypothetical protein F4820DRAFT_421770 [Hypoxylon rubiginosum]